MKQRTKGRFEVGRGAVAGTGLAGTTLICVLLLLGAVRLGAEAIKLLAYADVFVGGGKMLIYGEVNAVDMNKELSGRERTIPIYTELPQETSEDAVIKLNDGTTILYQGHTYELNRELATVLVLGIDHTIQNETVSGEGGQSDVILLIGIDTKTGESTILNISREANAQVDVYSADNQWIETRFEQITLAYAYGNGRETSCENAVRSVSRLLFGLPIGSYLALDMDGIQAANEAVGGVAVQSLIDIKMPDGTEVREGDSIVLHNKNLERYIRTRTAELDANAKRMERQKQYLTEFSKLAVQKSKQNRSFPTELFSTLSAYIVTNLELSDVTFLSSVYLQRGADCNFRTLEGSYGKYNGSTIFYVDEINLFETVLQIFYRQVA